jgi:DNA invertase Pin-like site-specific DNA recombinase
MSSIAKTGRAIHMRREVGGAIDPGSDAHDLVMALYGGMSKGERNRIKIRVRSAMKAQTALEGRYLGGRPPYGYRLGDAGPHPNPSKAAEGKRLHRLERDSVTAPIVERILTEYVAGRGILADAPMSPSSPSHPGRSRRNRRLSGLSVTVRPT